MSQYDEIMRIPCDPKRSPCRGVSAELAYKSGHRDARHAAAELAAAAEQPYSTTSDKYRAELYDEVWQKARDMGYGNVTEALIALERMKSDTVRAVEHQMKLLGQALGECIAAAGITRPGAALTGPELLMFADDLKEHLAEQPDTVPVPRELLSRHLEEIGEYAWDTYDEMRALLNKEGV